MRVELTSTNRSRAWILFNYFVLKNSPMVVLTMECSGLPSTIDLSGGDSDREPPVPIPNTEVKPVSADGTWGATPWESRSLPDICLGEGCSVLDGAALFLFDGR